MGAKSIELVDKKDLIDAFAQSMGIEAAEEFIHERIRLSGLENKPRYSLQELFRVSAMLIRVGGLVGVIAQTFTNNILTKLQEEAQQRADETERESEEIFDSVNIGIVLFDMETYRVVDINTKALQMIGYEEDEALSLTCADVFLQGDQAMCPSLELGESVDNWEAVIQTKEGGRIPALISVKAIKFKGRPCLLESIVDITPIKEVEFQLRRERQRAEEASRVKSRFLANMSHEIRTPLNAVIGFSDLLSSTSLNEDQQDYVHTIRESGSLLLSLISDILDISKIEAGEVELEVIPFSLRDLVKGVLKIAQPRLVSGRVNMQSWYDSRVPDFFQGDPTRIRQVLLNLLSNALKFTEEGSISLEVRVAEGGVDAGSETCPVILSVRDTGIGIPRERIDTIFDAFTQADTSTTRKFGGTGLGLAISKAFVEMMGGEIRVFSSPGQGSEFRIRLPLEKAAEDKPADINLHVPKSDSPAALVSDCDSPGRMNILVAEDNRVNQKLIKHLIGKLGHDVTLADNGAVAVEMALSRDFDICLMDLQMPEMGGVEATRVLRSRGKKPVADYRPHSGGADRGPGGMLCRWHERFPDQAGECGATAADTDPLGHPGPGRGTGASRSAAGLNRRREEGAATRNPQQRRSGEVPRRPGVCEGCEKWSAARRAGREE